MAWTPDQESKLRQLWTEGLSASEIAKQIPVSEGKPVSRDMVIGKARRLGLEGRPSPIQRKEDA